MNGIRLSPVALLRGREAFATGEYQANSNIALTQPDSNQAIQVKITFQITDR